MSIKTPCGQYGMKKRAYIRNKRSTVLVKATYPRQKHHSTDKTELSISITWGKDLLLNR
jgi:hypothetical protein